MTLALGEAARGRGRVEPNPMVGAVLVRDGALVGKGHHEQFGGPHAEVMALRAAGETAVGSTLYVTLEPCCHFGKTPPCTGAIIASGITRVVAAIHDPFAAVAGRGVEQLRQAGITVEVGCQSAEARRLNAAFLKRVVTGRPLVTAKWAMTLDGKTALASGDSRWISSEPSRERVHALRGTMDGILVGVGTVLADDPRLTARPPGPRTPTRIVLDGSARLPLESQLVQTARLVPVLVVVSDQAPAANRTALAEHGCEVIALDAGPRIPIMTLLDELGSRGMSNLLVEGGGRVLGSFLDAGEFDVVHVYIATILEGGDHPRSPIRGKGRRLMHEALRLHEAETSMIGGDVRIEGWLDQPWRGAAGFVG
jgi:diaminohydroxyphosphoribosylaminopyrimidine deaminase/5-amino-6-(5-phosphoribosylamino)uracil reductase